VKGKFRLLIDIASMVNFEIRKEKEAFNVPYIEIQAGSYFGD